MSTIASMTVLAENRTESRGLIAEHGLALWIEADGRRILFDTGQGLALAHNPKLMGVDLASTTDVVLSHGHYDHTGGLDTVLARVPRIRLYLHPEAFRERYSRQHSGRAESAGMTAPPDLDTRLILHPSASPQSLSPHIMLTGEIPRRTAYEDTGGAFYVDRECTRADQIPDDQALVIDTPCGSVIVLGCAHAGVVNTLDYVACLTRERPVLALIGGMHLRSASEERLDRTLEAIHRHDVKFIAPLHCTGMRATARIISAFPDRFLELRAGMRYDLV